MAETGKTKKTVKVKKASEKGSVKVEPVIVDLFGVDEKPTAPVKSQTKKTSVKQEKKSEKKIESKPETEVNKADASSNLIKNDKDPFAHYNSLSKYMKKCLVATNYWRVMNGMEIIEVPPEYEYYHKRFDKRCFVLYAQAEKHKEELANSKGN